MKKYPDNKIEQKYWEKGYNFVAGIDEAGRGPLAGPLVAAAVIFPRNFKNIFNINDSKKLIREQREELYYCISKQAISIGVCIVPEYVIDKVNIYNATIFAMEQAIDALHIKPQIALVDGMKLQYDNIIFQRIVKGDTISVSIAAASIIAKVIRDNIMINYHFKFPYYEFNKNVGYPTQAHKSALKIWGITPIHRKSYLPIKSLL